MSIFLKISIYVCIFTTAYLILCRDKESEKRKLKELKIIKIGVDKKRTNNWILKSIRKIPFYKSQNEIDKTGNSLGFTPISYLVSKILLTVIAFLVALHFLNNIVIGIVAATLAFFIIDILLNIDKNMEIDLIRLDLADVTNQIKFNANGESIEFAIANSVTSISKSKKLKKEYLILSSEIITTSRTIEALDKFRRKFDYEEIDEFVTMLEQGINTGSLESQLDGFLMLIEEDNIKYIKREMSKLRSKGNMIGEYFTMVILLMFMVVTVTMAFSGSGSIFSN